MDRDYFYSLINGSNELDYEIYLDTKQLLSIQKSFDQLCNKDELQFQIVHQIEELWMKLIAYTLLDIDEYIQQHNTNRVISLFKRVHQTQKLMIEQLGLLETMSPKEYQQIRLQLGNGSGQESPGFKTLLRMPQHLWHSYEQSYLENKQLTLNNVYNTEYEHCDAYMVAESLIEFDELFQKFRHHHMQLIHRTIGIQTKSLKGRPVENLNKGVRSTFFPQLWDVRLQMTNNWGSQHGIEREKLSQTQLRS